MTRDWLSAGWPIVRIRDIGRLHGGGTPSRKRPEFFQGTIPWITGQDIPESHVSEISTARDYVTKEAVQESATRVVPAGAVLVTTRVSVGKTAVAGCPICFSQDVTAILIHSPAIALPAYVAYFLRSRRDALLQKNQGSTIAGITRGSLALEQIPLPPLGEQQRIVEILQEVEEIRCLRTKAGAKTAELIPAMFYDHFGDGKKSGFLPLYQLSEVVSGVAIGRKTKGMTSEVPYIRVANVQAGFIDLNEVKTTTATEVEIEQFKLNNGDVLLTEGGDFDKLGRGCLWEGQVEPCIHQNHVFRVRPIPGKLNPHFFAHYLQSVRAKDYFLRCAKKTTNLASINLTQLKALPVPDISIEDQERFELLIQKAGECSSELGEKTFIALTQSLSTHAFSGKLTADWREGHGDQIALEVRQRESALKEAGAILTRSSRIVEEEIEELLKDRTDGIYAELNREHRGLLREINRMVGSDLYARYFSATLLSDYLSEGPLRRNPQAVEGHLAVFSARGLIIPVSREEQTEDTGEFIFGNAYRLPLLDYDASLVDEDADQIVTENGDEITVGKIGDFSRLRELERLGAQLENERALK